MRKPFDVIAEGILVSSSRDNKTAIELFLTGVRARKPDCYVFSSFKWRVRNDQILQRVFIALRARYPNNSARAALIFRPSSELTTILCPQNIPSSS